MYRRGEVTVQNEYEGNIERLLNVDLEDLEHHHIDQAMEEMTTEARVEAMSKFRELVEHFDFSEEEAQYVEDYLVENQEVRANVHRLVLGASLAAAGVDQIKDGAWRAYELDGDVHIEHRVEGVWENDGRIEWDFCEYCAPAYARNRIDDIDRSHSDRGGHPWDKGGRSLDDPYIPSTDNQAGPRGGGFYESGQFTIDNSNLIRTQSIDIDTEDLESFTVEVDADGMMRRKE